ncbi:MAG TPA: hypothetical protein VF801_08660 [Rhodocyclaceae bacterium]
MTTARFQGHNLFFVSAGMAVLLLFSLAIYALSWGLGGDAQLESMGGRAGLSIVVVGLIVAAISAAITKPRD